MHLRLTLLTADPDHFEDALQYIQNDARPRVENEAGNLGMTLKVRRPLGVAVVETFWVSGEAMRESDRNVRATRDEAEHRAHGTCSVESFPVAGLVTTGSWDPGDGVRVTRFDAPLDRVEQLVSGYEDTTLPWLKGADGFRGALLATQPRTGQAISETVWRDDEALAASRSAAAAIQVDTVKATDSAVRSLEEYTLTFSSAQQPGRSEYLER
jgi:hypothetical protein